MNCGNNPRERPRLLDCLVLLIIFFLYLKMKRRRLPVVEATCAQNKNVEKVYNFLIFVRD